MMNKQRGYYLVTLVLCLVSIAMLSVTWSYLPGQVPLWLTYPWGEGRLAPKIYLGIIPAIMAVVALINLLITKILRKYPEIIAKMLAIASMLAAIMLVLAQIGILQSLL